MFEMASKSGMPCVVLRLAVLCEGKRRLSHCFFSEPFPLVSTAESSFRFTPLYTTEGVLPPEVLAWPRVVCPHMSEEDCNLRATLRSLAAARAERYQTRSPRSLSQWPDHQSSLFARSTERTTHMATFANMR